ncbi:hypothetical protein KIH39_00640 [Telmatocola sphagniphila]|uniref:Uncharacterized protein n=1 Tax=Telmatocola sphagniphila TaxID=1123043 RepID=A0A8E6B5V3_9BACT|nr:hypothetical protein [Telmatocola sphagniphila]QVL32457.1 hypothetical protein KIH39_00640 [Telmatocola sphagniphila]
MEELLRSFSWVALAVGIIAVIAVIEVLLRTIANRFGTPQERFPHRVGTELPRMLRNN